MSEELIKRLRTEYALCSMVDGLGDVAAVLKDSIAREAQLALSRPAPAVQVPEVVRELIMEVRRHGSLRLASLAIRADGALAAAPVPATVATEAVSASEVAGVKRYIQSCADQVGDSVWGHLLIIDRLAAAAAVAQGGGVDVERSAFEAHMQNEFGYVDLSRDYTCDEGGTYNDRNVSNAWYGWRERALLSASPAGVGGWMPIETAPKDGRRVILTDGEISFEGFYFDGQWLRAQNENLAFATHWQPLPAAHAIAKQSEGE